MRRNPSAVARLGIGCAFHVSDLPALSRPTEPTGEGKARIIDTRAAGVKEEHSSRSKRSPKTRFTPEQSLARFPRVRTYCLS